MCDVLHVKRSTYYYQLNRCKDEVKKAEDVALSKEIERIFKMSRHNFCPITVAIPVFSLYELE